MPAVPSSWLRSGKVKVSRKDAIHKALTAVEMPWERMRRRSWRSAPQVRRESIGDRAEGEDEDRGPAPLSMVGPGAEEMGYSNADAAREHHEAAADAVDEDHGKHREGEVDGAGDDVEEYIVGSVAGAARQQLLKRMLIPVHY